MKLTKEMLEKLIKEEMAALSEKTIIDADKPEDAKAKELDADELGTDKALEEPKEFYTGKLAQESFDMIRALNNEEKRLVKRIRKIREQKVQHAKKLIGQ